MVSNNIIVQYLIMSWILNYKGNIYQGWESPNAETIVQFYLVYLRI